MIYRCLELIILTQNFAAKGSVLAVNGIFKHSQFVWDNAITLLAESYQSVNPNNTFLFAFRYVAHVKG